jgi:hypothetical protein
VKSEGTIARHEAAGFRRARIAWPFSLTLIILAAMTKRTLWLLLPLLAAHVVITIYLLTWRCPRCHKWFCIRFAVFSVAWPYFSKCLHCDSRLEGA